MLIIPPSAYNEPGITYSRQWPNFCSELGMSCAFVFRRKLHMWLFNEVFMIVNQFAFGVVFFRISRKHLSIDELENTKYYYDMYNNMH